MITPSPTITRIGTISHDPRRRKIRFLCLRLARGFLEGFSSISALNVSTASFMLTMPAFSTISSMRSSTSTEKSRILKIPACALGSASDSPRLPISVSLTSNTGSLNISDISSFIFSSRSLNKASLASS